MRNSENFVQVYVRKRLKKKLKQLSFNNEVKLQVLVSAVVEYVLEDQERIQQVLQKIKENKG